MKKPRKDILVGIWSFYVNVYISFLYRPIFYLQRYITITDCNIIIMYVHCTLIDGQNIQNYYDWPTFCHFNILNFGHLKG